MKWEYIGAGLALIGIGLTMVLALPPPGWPTMPIWAVRFGIATGGVLIIVGGRADRFGRSPLADCLHASSLIRDLERRRRADRGYGALLVSISRCNHRAGHSRNLARGTCAPKPRNRGGDAGIAERNGYKAAEALVSNAWGTATASSLTRKSRSC